MELIHEKRVFPDSSTCFKHALTQEVAYGSLLVQRRKELHRLIGLAIEELYRDRARRAVRDPRVSLREGRGLGKGAGVPPEGGRQSGPGVRHARRPRALRRGRGNGRSGARGLRADADDHPPATSGALRPRERLRTRPGRVGAVLRLARQGGDQHAEGEALVSMGQASLLGHHFDQCLEESRQAAKIAETIGAQSILAGSLLNEAIVYGSEVTGRLDHARTKFDHALALSRQTVDVVNQATALIYGAELESWEGHYARAAELYDEGIRLGRVHKSSPRSRACSCRGSTSRARALTTARWPSSTRA